MNPSTAVSAAVCNIDTGSVNTQFRMGDEIQTQRQPEPQPQLQLPVQSQPEIQNSIGSVAVSVPVTSDLTNVPPQGPTPSAKLAPLRSRKIRKLSTDFSTGVVDTGSTVFNSADASISTSTSASTTALTIVPVFPESDVLPISSSSSTSKAAKNKIVVAGVAQSNTQSIPPPLRMMTRSLSYPGEIDRAIQHLRNADPHLAQLIDLHQPPTFDSFQTPFLALAKSILYQQLAYKAGNSIYTRFVDLCGGEEGVLPDTVLAFNPQQLRQIGVSGRKASYLHDLARKFKNGILSDESIINMDDKSLFTMLTMVNGIGSWSVHMFMIFSLHRPDVLPVNDLGVRKGVLLLYGMEELPKPSQMELLCDKWRPYRSVASWYLWRFVEAKGTPSSAAAVAAAGMSLQQQQEVVEQQLHQQNQQQQHPQQQQHQLPLQPPPQFIDPINGMINLGACAWGQ